MKKLSLALILALLALTMSAAVEAGQQNIPEGMEIRKIDGFNLLVPKDAKVWYDGDVLKVEDPSEYSASRLLELGKRIDQIEQVLEDLQAQMS